MTKKIRVKKSVLQKIKELEKTEEVPETVETASTVARVELTRPYRCCWCFTVRGDQDTPHKTRCELCGHFGVTLLEERDIRNVYVEFF